MIQGQWLSEKWVVLQIDHAQGEVQGSLEIGIIFAEFFLGQRLLADSGPGQAKGREARRDGALGAHGDKSMEGENVGCSE